MAKFEKIYVPHPNFRFPTAPLYALADEIVYAVDAPMFDDMIGDEHKSKFEDLVSARMEDFDPVADCVAFYGDPIVFAMMIAYVFTLSDFVNVARYSQKLDRYVIRKINIQDWAFHE